MTERTKKILFSVLFIFTSIAMGYGLYWMFFRAQIPVRPKPPVEQPIGELPQAGTGQPPGAEIPTAPGGLPTSVTIPSPTPTEVAPSRVTLLRDGITQAVSPATDGNGARFYNPEDGRFYRVNADGTITLLSEKQFFNVDKVSWGKQEDQAILEFPDGRNIYYNFDEKRQVTLQKHWEEFDFSPSDQKIAAKSIGLDENQRFLMIANPDGTEAKAIEPMGENANLVHVSWTPNTQVVAYSETGEFRGGGEQEILFIGQNHENFRSLVAPGQGFTPNWSPTGKQLLFSVWNKTTDNKPALWLTSGDPNTIGSNRRSLNILTWADKCVWSTDTELFCAVPQILQANSGLQREKFATNPDDVMRINLTNGTVTKINLPDQNYPVRQPVLNRDRTKLIFTDAATGKLYSYDIP